MSSSFDVCVGIIIAVFDSINELEKSERAKAARQVLIFESFYYIVITSSSSLAWLYTCNVAWRN